jgi:tripartite-type tricarboxylate transporter receptor subunit TctC
LPQVDRILGRKPAYSRDRFVGISRLTADPVILLARANSNFKSLAHLLKFAHENPGRVSYSTGGNYSGIHLPFALLSQSAGIEMLSVPYKGGGPAMAGFLAGEVDVTGQVPSVAATYLKSGMVIPLAHTGRSTLKHFPNVPSLSSSGIKSEFYLWVGLFGQSGIDPVIVAKFRHPDLGGSLFGTSSQRVDHFRAGLGVAEGLLR